jgi:hypothetical protein
MEAIKRQYHAPELIDQGSIVAETRALCHGECWDGAPLGECDCKPCDDDETSLS